MVRLLVILACALLALGCHPSSKAPPREEAVGASYPQPQEYASPLVVDAKAGVVFVHPCDGGEIYQMNDAGAWKCAAGYSGFPGLVPIDGGTSGQLPTTRLVGSLHVGNDLVGTTSDASVTAARNGALLFSDSGTIACASGDINCTFGQNPTSTGNGANQYLQPQPSTKDGGTSGNEVVILHAGIGLGSSDYLELDMPKGTPIGWWGLYPGATDRALLMGQGTSGLVNPPTASNVTIDAFSTATIFNDLRKSCLGLSDTPVVCADNNATFEFVVTTATNAAFFYNGTSGGSYGGGVQVIQIGNASTPTTSAPAAGDVLEAVSGSLQVRTSSNDSITLAPATQGTITAQVPLYRQYSAVGTTNAASGTATLTIPAGDLVSGDACKLSFGAIGKETAGDAGTVNTGYFFEQPPGCLPVRNASGTVAIGATTCTCCGGSLNVISTDPPQASNTCTGAVVGSTIVLTCAGSALSAHVEWLLHATMRCE